MADQESRHTNRLAQETSPYLLQHAHNPVTWFPWGDEALARAKAQDKPIFLSIGYAACHWCHVMERESFEDADTARDLNEGFVAIKVDREERPDLDAIYMDAVQQMTGSGGWPMSVFLTPDGRPFFGGTYFPDQPRHGLPSFRQVLAGVSEAWRDRRDELERSGTQLVHTITAHAALPAAAQLEAAALDEALAQVERGFDARTGGWGGAPKFPQPMTIEFLLRTAARTGSASALAIARRSLDAMAAGGIHDHLGGGFARYATDSIWLVPHFEKMLYDNALLARAYVHAWQLTRDERYREVALDSLTFMERDLLTADGGFAASLDADTAGIEGATYVWTLPEVEALLGDAALSAEFCRAYGVTPEGNFEGHTILSRVADGDEERLRTARATVFAARQKRPQPARDDKVLTAWNGLAIAAFADAAAAFDEPRLAGVASRAANLLLTRVRGADGRLSRSWKDDRALHAGTLEDYTHLADGLLALYQATFDERWFVGARDLADQVLAHFGDPTGGFFDTADDHEALITRPKGLQDNAIPSGSAMAAEVLLRMAAFTGEARYGDAAEQALRATTAYARRYPTAFAQWLSALTLAVGDVVEVAIAGDPGASDAQSLLAVVRAGYRPLAVLAAGSSGSVPLLDDRPQRDGRATAYVCRNFVCRAPVAEPADLAAQLTSAA